MMRRRYHQGNSREDDEFETEAFRDAERADERRDLDGNRFFFYFFRTSELYHRAIIHDVYTVGAQRRFLKKKQKERKNQNYSNLIIKPPSELCQSDTPHWLSGIQGASRSTPPDLSVWATPFRAHLVEGAPPPTHPNLPTTSLEPKIKPTAC